jgi:hypothetical protein
VGIAESVRNALYLIIEEVLKAEVNEEGVGARH